MSKQNDIVHRDKQIATLKAKHSALTRRYNSAIRQLSEAEQRNELVDVLKTRAGGKRAAIGRLGKQAGKSVAILALTDWHCEERIDAESVNGLNRFNLSVAAQRITTAAQKGIKLLDAWRCSFPIDELVVWLGGDIITGYIHEELIENNYLSPTEAVLFAQDKIHDVLQFLLKESNAKRITVPTSYGNHGRTTAKIRISSGHKNSYEWLMYRNLERAFRSEPRIVWQVANSYHNLLNVNGHLIRFHHGDGLRYAGGVGGITIPVNKRIASWNKTGRSAALDIFGHWHQFMDNWRFVSCGCLCGYNPYAIQIGADFQPPTQTFIVVSKRHGKVAALPIFVG